MRTLRIYTIHLFLLFAAACVTTGCDDPVSTARAVENPKEMSAEQREPLAPAQSDAGSGTATDSDVTEPVVDQQPVPVQLNAPSGQSGSQTTEVTPEANTEVNPKVDHNDPTSYPVTKLAEKQDGQILMLSWNVESECAEADTVCEELSKLNTELNAEDRYDVVALTEVLPQDLKKFRLALGKHYKYAYSKSGWNDRLQILYNENKFKKVRHFELDEINVNGRYRAPLVVHLKQLETDVEFLVMVNHLARGKSEIRQEQAKLLVEWGRDQNLPVFGLGDYNFDYEFSSEKGNPAFVNFMQDNIWRWLKPTELVDTNWYDNPKDPDGKDDFPGSMLDFAFVAGPAKDWTSSCQIIVRENDFPDDEKTSDHRPYEVVAQK